MFTDMVGFSAAARSDEAAALALLREAGTILRPLFGRFGGRAVKSTGDGFLVEFPSALKAVECALEVQGRLGERNAERPDRPLRLRIGIHLGDVERRRGDILGDAVNIASRVEPLADPGGVCITAQVFDQVRDKLSADFEPLPPQTVKNLDRPLELYKVRPSVRVDRPPAAVGGLPRLAVLPFANISPDAKDEYFADGLTEELITTLSRLPQVRVIARTSVMPYKGVSKPIPHLGSELGVTSVMEGSVRKSGDRLRITAQLIDVRSQEHVWAETFDRRLDDVFSIQTDVARNVAEALRVKLGAPEGQDLALGREVDPRSYLLYLEGRSILNESFSTPGREKARRLFERALAIDPGNSRAHAGLAEAFHSLGLWHYARRRSVYERKAEEHAARAIAIDPRLAEGHGALGLIYYDRSEYAAAEREAKAALALNPSSAEVRRWYASLLVEELRVDEALQQYRLAQEADPHSMHILFGLIDLLMYRRDLDGVKAEIDRVERVDPTGRMYHDALAWWHYARGEVALALAEARRAERLPDDEGRRQPAYSVPQILALTGRKADARRALVRVGRAPGPVTQFDVWQRGITYACLGDLDRAYKWFNAAVDRGGLPTHWIRLDPNAENVRRDPRYPQLLARLNLA